MLRLDVAAKLHSCSDTRVLAAVDAGSDEQRFAVLRAIDDSDGNFYVGVWYGQVGAQLLTAFNSQPAYFQCVRHKLTPLIYSYIFYFEHALVYAN